MREQQPHNADTFDPGAKLCGHGDRCKRIHYLGGGLWVCFECFARLLLGGRGAAEPPASVRPPAHAEPPAPAEVHNIRKAHCPGRGHGHHIGDVCTGACCTTCGGPIDENAECRC